MLVGVKPFFLKSRKTEHGLLRPFKRMLVDIIASEEQLDAALDAANVLFLALEAQGHRVALAPVNTGLRRPQVDERVASKKHDQYHPSPWAPDRPTVVYIAGVPMGLTLFEMTEDVAMMYVRGDYVPVKTLTAAQLQMFREPAHWTAHKPSPSGRFCLQAYCADPLVQWRKQWRVASGPALGALVPAVVSELEADGPSLADQLVEAAARAEARRREWEAEVRRHEEERKRALQAKARHQARADLLTAFGSGVDVGVDDKALAASTVDGIWRMRGPFNRALRALTTTRAVAAAAWRDIASGRFNRLIFQSRY